MKIKYNMKHTQLEIERSNKLTHFQIGEVQVKQQF